MNQSRKNKLLMIAKVGAVSLGVYVVFKYMLPIIAPFILAYGICRWLYPMTVFVRKKTRIPVGMTAAAIIFSAAAVLAAGVYFIGKYLIGQMIAVIKNIEYIWQAVQNLFLRICSRIGHVFKCDADMVYQWIDRFSTKIGENAHIQIVDLLTDRAVPVFKSIGVFLVIIMVAMIGAILLIKNKARIDRQIRKSDFSAEISEISEKVWAVIGCFIKSQILIIIVISAICSAGLILAKIPYSVLIGILIGMMDALPVIGSGTVLVPWAVIGLFFGKYKMSVILFIVYGLCAFTREILEARLMGNSLGINEFYMLMATFAGINLFGISGIILGPLGVILVMEICCLQKKNHVK